MSCCHPAVAKILSFFLGQNHRVSGSIGKALEDVPLSRTKTAGHRAQARRAPFQPYVQIREAEMGRASSSRKPAWTRIG